MSQIIFKYKIECPAEDTFSIEIPETARILTVQTQNEQPYIWALVSRKKENKKVYRTFRIAGTGHIINEKISEYIGTFQLENGGLVFHLFEIEKE